MSNARPAVPPHGPAALVLHLADSVAAMLVQLVDRGSVSAEEMQDLVTAHIVAMPAVRDDLARNLLLQQVLLRLHAHVPARGRA